MHRTVPAFFGLSQPFSASGIDRRPPVPSRCHSSFRIIPDSSGFFHMATPRGDRGHGWRRHSRRPPPFKQRKSLRWIRQTLAKSLPASPCRSFGPQKTRYLPHASHARQRKKPRPCSGPGLVGRPLRGVHMGRRSGLWAVCRQAVRLTASHCKSDIAEGGLTYEKLRLREAPGPCESASENVVARAPQLSTADG